MSGDDEILAFEAELWRAQLVGCRGALDRILDD